MKKQLFKSMVWGACALAGASTARADITEWEEPATAALTTIRSRVAAEPGGNQVLVLPEFPNYDTESDSYEFVNSTFLLPTAVSADYSITELNNAGAYCGHFQELTETTNAASVNIAKVWTLGLDLVAQLSTAILNSQALNETLQNDPSQPFSVVAATESLRNLLGTRIESNQALAQTLATQIQARGSAPAYQQLKSSYAALIQESKTGVPATSEAAALQAEITALVSQRGSLQSTINTLAGFDPNNPALPGLRAQLDNLDAQLSTKQAAFDALVAPYRAQKAEEAAQFKLDQLEPYEAITADYQAQLDTANQQIIDDQLASSNALLDPAYVEARGKLNVLDVMLDEADKLLTRFRAIRDPATKDALFAINYGRTTLNDWAAIDAGVAVDQFPIWTQQLTALPNAVSYAGYTAGLANLYDLSVRSKVTQILNEPAAQLPMYSVDLDSGTITPVPSLDLPDITGQGQRAKNLIEIVNPSDVVSDFFALPVLASFNGVNAALRLPRKKLTTTPTVRIRVTLGTYCGELRSESVAGPDTPINAGGQSLVLKPRRTALSFQSRAFETSGDGGLFFPTSLNGTYNVAQQFKPANASCHLEIDDYDSYVRNWGKVTHNYIFWKSTRSWDDTKIYNESNHTLKCHFEDTNSTTDEAHKKELAGFNQMAINEVMAQFVQANAKQPMPLPARFSDETLNQFANEFPRHTWSPTMLALCGGVPICNIAGIILDNVGTAVTSSSTSVTRTGRVDLSLDVSRVYAGMVPHNFNTAVRFFIH